MIQNLEEMKCVLIVDSTLTIGEQANAAAVLVMTIGAKNSEIIGGNVSTLDNISHQGITQLNLPVLTASEEILRKIHEQARANDKVFLVDFKLHRWHVRMMSSLLKCPLLLKRI